MKAKGSLTKQEAEVEVTENEIKAFFDGVVSDFVKEGGGIISDTVRFWRWQNQVRIIKKAQEIIEKKGLTKQQVPLKVLYPLLENSSLEEDETMQVKWSNLLANATSGNVRVTPNYVELLKELSPTEALVLDKYLMKPKPEKQMVIKKHPNSVSKRFANGFKYHQRMAILWFKTFSGWDYVVNQVAQV